MMTKPEVNSLSPHSAYKPSSVSWLEKVPEHWEVTKLRHILTSAAERNRPDLPLLSVVREKGVILRDLDNPEDNHNIVPEDLTNYKVVHQGQFAMNKMKAWQGSYGVSPCGARPCRPKPRQGSPYPSGSTPRSCSRSRSRLISETASSRSAEGCKFARFVLTGLG